MAWRLGKEIEESWYKRFLCMRRASGISPNLVVGLKTIQQAREALVLSAVHWPQSSTNQEKVEAVEIG